MLSHFSFAVGWLHAALVHALAIVVLVAISPSRRAAAKEVAAVVALALAAASLAVIAVPLLELVTALSSASAGERAQFRYRIVGPHAWVWWLEAAVAALPLLFWVPSVRRRLVWMAVVVVLVVGHQLWRAWQDAVVANALGGI